MIDQVHVIALCAAAVAYPIYSFLLANPAYLVANRIESGRIYGLVAVISIALPLAICKADGIVTTINQCPMSDYSMPLVPINVNVTSTNRPSAGIDKEIV